MSSSSVLIGSFGLVIPGQVVRKYDTADDTTTVTITGDQAKAMYEALGTVVQFFGLNGTPAAAPENP